MINYKLFPDFFSFSGRIASVIILFITKVSQVKIHKRDLT